jgi:hypothetical protein
MGLSWFRHLAVAATGGSDITTTEICYCKRKEALIARYCSTALQACCTFVVVARELPKMMGLIGSSMPRRWRQPLVPHKQFSIGSR